MSEDNKNGLSDQETDDLLANLNARASTSPAPDASAQEEDEGGEDIEAFLASLEGGEGASSSAPPNPAQPSTQEPDPFADAFAALETEHGDDVEAEFQERMAKLEAEQKSKAPKPAPKPAPAPVEEEPVPEPEANDELPEPAPTPESKKGDKKKKKKSKKDKKKDLQVVDSERSPGFIRAMAALKWSLLLLPVFTFWWVGGSFLAQWFSTGWVVALIATIAAFILPLVLVFVVKRGRWGWWAAGIGVLATTALIAPWPAAAGSSIARYGHWPVSTVGQLAGWSVDNAGSRVTGFVSEFLGVQLARLADPNAGVVTKVEDADKATEPTPEELAYIASALGEEMSLERAAAKAEAKPSGKENEKEDKKADEAKEKEPAEKEEAPAKEEAAPVDPGAEGSSSPKE